MNDPGPASALQPWTSACHLRPATPPPSPRLPPHPPPSPPPLPWSPPTAAGALSHTSSHGWVRSCSMVSTTLPRFIFKVDFLDLISHIEFDAQCGFVEDVGHSERLTISISGLEMRLERNLIRSTAVIRERCYTLIANAGEVKSHKWLSLTNKESCGALASLT